ncbi:MAG: ABC transporter permease [Rhizobium sp.]
MIESFLRIVALIRKELLAMLKDPRARFLLVLPPILQSLIFGYAATYDLNNVPYALLDLDRSEASRELVSRFDGSGVFARMATLRRTAEIGEYIDSRKALIVVVIDHGFERDLMAGERSAVQVIADGRNSNTAGTATGYVTSIAETFLQDWRTDHGVTGAGPLKLSTRAWYNPNLETRWNMITSMIAMITLTMTMILTALSVAREREEGTFEQLLVTPFRPGEIMIGKAIPSMMVGLTQSTLILLVAQFWFQIPFSGSYLLLYTGLVFFLAAVVGVGLFLSALSLTMQQAMISTFVVIMPFTLLSGMTTPIGNMPEVLQYLTLINPLRYAISITHQVYLEGAGLREVGGELLSLVAIASVTLPVSAWLFRHRI